MPLQGGASCGEDLLGFHFASSTSREGDESTTVIAMLPKVVVRFCASRKGEPSLSTSSGIRSYSVSIVTGTGLDAISLPDGQEIDSIMPDL